MKAETVTAEIHIKFYDKNGKVKETQVYQLDTFTITRTPQHSTVDIGYGNPMEYIPKTGMRVSFTGESLDGGRSAINRNLIRKDFTRDPRSHILNRIKNFDIE